MELKKWKELKKMNSKIKYSCPVCHWTPAEYEPVHGWEHCPNCLSNIHELNEAGNECGGIYEPVGIWVIDDYKWEIIQRCTWCGGMRSTPLHEDDNPLTVLSVASKPLAKPPFPVEKAEELTRLMGGRGDIGGYYK